jgi:hypothetical protein
VTSSSSVSRKPCAVKPSVGDYWPRNEAESGHATLVHDIETGGDQESAESLRRERSNRLASDGGELADDGVSDVGNGSNRCDQKMSAGSQQRSQAHDDLGLIAIPMKRFGAHHDIDRLGPQGKVLSIGLHHSGTGADARRGRVEHAYGIVDADHVSVRESFGQPQRELARAAPEIEEVRRLHAFEPCDHCVVNRAIHRVLKSRSVIRGGPSIE